jgi:hypothetical protein
VKGGKKITGLQFEKISTVNSTIKGYENNFEIIYPSCLSFGGSKP